RTVSAAALSAAALSGVIRSWPGLSARAALSDGLRDACRADVAGLSAAGPAAGGAVPDAVPGAVAEAAADAAVDPAVGAAGGGAVSASAVRCGAVTMPVIENGMLRATKSPRVSSS